MPQLDNPKYEAFAQAIASGRKASDAYRATMNPNVSGARQLAHALLKDNDDIRERVREIQKLAATTAVLTLAEKRKFLRDVVMTPVGAVTPESILCQEFKYAPESTTIKMPSKLAAIELDAKLSGEFKERVEITGDPLLEVMKHIRSRGNKRGS